MTTWQDEPPTSRRALRERERARSQATADPLTADTRTADARANSAQAVPPSFRVRDYSPEARGSQFSTVGGADAFATQPYSEPVPQATVPAAPPVDERTLTRRELRALREAAEQARNSAPAAPPELVDPLEPRQEWQQPTVVEPQHAAPQQFEPPQPAPAPVAPQQFAQPVPPPAPQQFVQPEPQQPDPSHFEHAAPPAPPQFAQPAPQPEPQHPQQQFSAPQQFAQPQPPSPSPLEWAREPEPAPDVVVVPQAEFAPPAPEFDLPPEVPGESFVRPEGHWSRQADLDDRTQLGDILPSRDLSRSDAITTSALVLPSMPLNPIGPLSPTGEILVTGSIDLPRMLGATGVHPARFDHSEVDTIIDATDREDSHPNSSPVRAIRAVSSHTSTQGIIAAKRPRSKWPTYVLAGVASVMGVGVVVLFVGGMLLDLF